MKALCSNEEKQLDRLKTIFDNAPLVMAIVDDDVRVEDINYAGAGLSGNERATNLGLLGGEVINCIHALEEGGCGKAPSCRECVIRNSVGETFKSGKNLFKMSGSVKILHEGQSVELDVLVSTICLPDGDDKRVLVSVDDITTQRSAEREVRQLKQQVEYVLGATKTGMKIVDLDYNIKYIDPEWAKIYGDPTDGKCFGYFRDRNDPCPGCGLIKALETKKTTVTEQVLPKENNRPIQVTAIPFQSESGDWMVAAVYVDINERKAMEKQLHEVKEAAEFASRAKSDFLASMSHELRTPLNAIIGFSQMLHERYYGDLNEKQMEYVSDIVTSGQHLLALINEILDLARIEAGKMELELSDVNVKSLLEGSLVMIKEKALKHGITLVLDDPEKVGEMVIEADERKLKQVLFNLLSNAAKFTSEGGSIELEARSEDSEMIISVADTGIGLEPGDLQKVFEEFYLVSGSTQNKIPGTGLGLPLSKGFVELHGGRIWAESEGEGKGSTFTFTIPVKVKSKVQGPKSKGEEHF